LSDKKYIPLMTEKMAENVQAIVRVIVLGFYTNALIFLIWPNQVFENGWPQATIGANGRSLMGAKSL